MTRRVPPPPPFPNSAFARKNFVQKNFLKRYCVVSVVVSYLSVDRGYVMTLLRVMVVVILSPLLLVMFVLYGVVILVERLNSVVAW